MSRCGGAGKTPVLFPPGWLEKTSKEPQLARNEILTLMLTLNRVQAENSTVRAQRDELERNAMRFNRRLAEMALASDKECARARRSEGAQSDTRGALEALEKFQSRLETRTKEAQLERDKSSLKAKHLKRQLCKVEKELRAAKRGASNISAMSAIKKLALDNAVGKRLVAAAHPDKVPFELNGSACELFRFLQTIRESELS